jgi:hypothetical protein
MYAGGVETFATFRQCIYCEACFDRCEPAGYCPRGGTEQGCSAMFGSCETCAYSECSWNFPAQSGECIREYSACDADEDCLSLWNCLDGC